MPKQTEHQINLGLLRTYGITWIEFNVFMLVQGGVCAVCGNTPKTVRLNVDHDHKVARRKIKMLKGPSGWVADVEGFGVLATGTVRKKVREVARRLLLKHSIRGLLCGRCNRAMEMFRDKPLRMLVAIKYLDKFFRTVYPIQAEVTECLTILGNVPSAAASAPVSDQPLSQLTWSPT